MSKTALICDAEATIRTKLKSMLNGLGFDEVWECGNGKRALEMALGYLPDIMIIDVAMPDTDGISVAVEIKKKLKLAIMLLTNKNDAATAKRAAKCGIDAFLVKPLREQDLLPAIEIAMAHTREVDCLRETIEDLKETIQNRKFIERAKGVLMEKEHLSESEAHRTLQKMAMNDRKSLNQIAGLVLNDHQPLNTRR